MVFRYGQLINIPNDSHLDLQQGFKSPAIASAMTRYSYLRHGSAI